MTAHDIKLVALRKRDIVARDTLAFALDKPPGFTFKAGQAIDVSLIDPAEMDAKGPRRAFSIVSAPHENHILLATRTRDSAFKRILGRMRSEEHTSELQSRRDLVCRLLLEK